MAKQSFCAQADFTYEEKSGFLHDMSYHATSKSLVNADFDSWVKEWQLTPEDLEHYFPEYYNSSDPNPKELTDDAKKLILEKIIAQSLLEEQLETDPDSSAHRLLATSCPPGQYANTWGTCKNCDAGCKKCSSFLWRTVCKTCFDSTQKLVKGLCKCPEGLVRSSDNLLCCSAFCASCTSNKQKTKTTCDTCKTGFVLSAKTITCSCVGDVRSGNCVSCTGNKFFDGKKCTICTGVVSSDRLRCIMCDPGNFMDVDTKCKKCVGDVSLDQTSCAACTGSKFYDSEAKKCVPCDAVVSSDKLTCIHCEAGEYVTKDACTKCIGDVGADLITCNACTGINYFDAT